MFTPHQFVIKDFKDLQHVLTTRIVDDITRFYKFNNFGSSPLPSDFVSHSDNLSKLWHGRFGHLNYRSLKKLCKYHMVICLSMVSYRDGHLFCLCTRKTSSRQSRQTCLLERLGSLRACAVTCVVLFHLLPFSVSNIS